MRFRVLHAADASERAAWLALWRAWPGREPMALPAYAELFARPRDRVVCAVGEDTGGTILFPLILRPLGIEPWAAGEERHDAVTPYGYGGPFAWGDGPREDRAYWQAYETWCRAAGVLTTFARLSLFPDELAELPVAPQPKLQNIVVPLTGGPEALWHGYEGKVRKWVGVAERAGLTVEADFTGARLDAFVQVYTHTMERNGAERFYFFPRAFFSAIVEELGGQFAFFHTLSRGEVVSSDLLLCSAERVYYFLGGTHADAFPLGPNYLLKHHIGLWAMESGRKEYVLGGGYEPGDGLFRYKRAYARHGERTFSVASLTHDARACDELTAQRVAFAARSGETWTPRVDYFPPYRS